MGDRSSAVTTAPAAAPADVGNSIAGPAADVPATGSRISGGALSALRAPASSRAVAPLTLGPGTPSAAEAEAIRLVNVERVAAGCSALAVSPLLTQLARAHSQNMTAPGGFRHNSPDGRTPFQRLRAAGYDYSVAAENIAAGQPTAAAVMTAWMSSRDHRTNILDCRLTQIGVGVVYRAGSQYGTYWTQDLATPM